jgi:hypothetical protein
MFDVVQAHPVENRDQPAVDHIVPVSWEWAGTEHLCRPTAGGVDHPRNYCAMHRSLNASFRDVLPENKMAYIERHSRNAMRRVREFVATIQGCPIMRQALRIHLRDRMPLWST